MSCAQPGHSKKKENIHELFTINRNNFRDSTAILDTSEFAELVKVANRPDEYMQNILNKIEDNLSIVHIHECPTYIQLKASHSKTDQIEKALIHNLNKYSEYPSDYTHCLIVEHLLRSNFKATSNSTVISGLSIADENETILADANKTWQVLHEQQWFIYETFILDRFKNVVYMNEKTKQIVLAIQGPVLELKKYFKSDYEQNVNKYFGDHILSLFFHVKKCIELSRRLKYNISFTGFWLGGWLAQLSVLFCHVYFDFFQTKAVVFESFGIGECIEQMNLKDKTNKIDMAKFHIRSYVLPNNFINTYNSHLSIEEPASSVHAELPILIKYNPDDLHEDLTDEILRAAKISPKKVNLDPFYLFGFQTLNTFSLNILLSILKNNSTEVTYVKKNGTYLQKQSCSVKLEVQLIQKKQNTVCQIDDSLIERFLTSFTELVAFYTGYFNNNFKIAKQFKKNITSRYLATNEQKLFKKDLKKETLDESHNLSHSKLLKLFQLKSFVISNLIKKGFEFKQLINLRQSYTIANSSIVNLMADPISLVYERLDYVLRTNFNLKFYFTDHPGVLSENRLRNDITTNMISKQQQHFFELTRRVCIPEEMLSNFSDICFDCVFKSKKWMQSKCILILGGQSKCRTAFSFKYIQSRCRDEPNCVFPVYIDGSRLENMLKDFLNLSQTLCILSHNQLKGIVKELKLGIASQFAHLKFIFIVDNLWEIKLLDEINECFELLNVKFLVTLATNRENLIDSEYFTLFVHHAKSEGVINVCYKTDNKFLVNEIINPQKSTGDEMPLYEQLKRINNLVTAIDLHLEKDVNVAEVNVAEIENELRILLKHINKLIEALNTAAHMVFATKNVTLRTIATDPRDPMSIIKKIESFQNQTKKLSYILSQIFHKNLKLKSDFKQMDLIHRLKKAIKEISDSLYRLSPANDYSKVRSFFADQKVLNFLTTLTEMNQILVDIFNDRLFLTELKIKNDLFDCHKLPSSDLILEETLYVFIDANKNVVKIYDSADEKISEILKISQEISSIKLNEDGLIHLESDKWIKIYKFSIMKLTLLYSNWKKGEDRLVGTEKFGYYLMDRKNVITVYSHSGLSLATDSDLQAEITRLITRTANLKINQIEKRNETYYIRCQNNIKSCVYLWKNNLIPAIEIEYNFKTTNKAQDKVDFKFGSINQELVVRDWNEKVYKFYTPDGKLLNKIVFSENVLYDSVFMIDSHNEVIYVNKKWNLVSNF